jgi:hypothetical protein
MQSRQQRRLNVEKENTMSNIIAQLTARIEEYRAENKNPCKNYATEAAAEKATAAAAEKAGKYFDSNGRAPRYVVFFIPAWNRWVGCMDYSEMFQRSSCNGGYLGAVKGFFTY